MNISSLKSINTDNKINYIKSLFNNKPLSLDTIKLLTNLFYTQLKEHVFFASSLNVNSFSFLLHSMSFEIYDKDDIIIKQGASNNAKFYYIYSGSVAFYEKKHTVLLGTLLRIINMGEFFGEKAIIEKNNYRTVSAVAVDRCGILAIEKSWFESNLKQNLLKKSKLKINYFTKNFKWDRDDVIKIFYSFRYERYVKDQHIIKENEICNKIFFIKKGKLEVSQNISNNYILGKYQKDLNYNIIYNLKSSNKKYVIHYNTLSDNAIFNERLIDSNKYDTVNKYNVTVKSDKCSIFYIDVSEIINIKYLINILKKYLTNYYKFNKNNKKNIKKAYINNIITDINNNKCNNKLVFNKRKINALRLINNNNTKNVYKSLTKNNKFKITINRNNSTFKINTNRDILKTVSNNKKNVDIFKSIVSVTKNFKTYESNNYKYFNIKKL